MRMRQVTDTLEMRPGSHNAVGQVAHLCSHKAVDISSWCPAPVGPTHRELVAVISGDTVIF